MKVFENKIKAPVKEFLLKELIIIQNNLSGRSLSIFLFIRYCTLAGVGEAGERSYNCVFTQ